MAIKSGVSINAFIKSINDELDKKQDLLTAGDHITIKESDGKLVISADYESVPIYSLTFTTDKFENDTLSIPVADHKCGTTPVLRYIQEGSDENGWENVMVDVKMDSAGNITIGANPFNGRLLFAGPVPKADDVQSMTTNILTGSVTV